MISSEKNVKLFAFLPKSQFEGRRSFRKNKLFMFSFSNEDVDGARNERAREHQHPLSKLLHSNVDVGRERKKKILRKKTRIPLHA